MDYPDDSDGESLKLAADAGADLTRSMIIDFTVSVPDERAAREVAERVEIEGFDPSISDDRRDGRWSVYCSVSMLATYDGVVGAQKRLNEIAATYAGRCEGWATFGNGALGEDDDS